MWSGDHQETWGPGVNRPHTALLSVMQMSDVWLTCVPSRSVKSPRQEDAMCLRPGDSTCSALSWVLTVAFRPVFLLGIYVQPHTPNRKEASKTLILPCCVCSS